MILTGRNDPSGAEGRNSADWWARRRHDESRAAVLASLGRRTGSRSLEAR